MIFISSKKKIHKNDMADFLCDTVISLAWKDKTLSVDEYNYDTQQKSKWDLFRNVTIASAYYFAFLRLNLVNNTDLKTLEEILVDSRNLFSNKLGKHTLFVYTDEDKEQVEGMLKQAYNNARQCIVESNSKSIDEIFSFVAQQYIHDFYGDAKLSKKDLDEIIELNQKNCEQIIKKIFEKTKNLSDNIKITNSKKYEGKYIPYEIATKKKTDDLIKMMDASAEDKAKYLRDILKK